MIIGFLSEDYVNTQISSYSTSKYFLCEGVFDGSVLNNEVNCSTKNSSELFTSLNKISCISYPPTFDQI